MYKMILIAIVIAIFAGCTAPIPEQKPAWFSSPPTDYKLYYEVAAASTLQKAKNRAISSLRRQIKADVNAAFKTKNHALGKISDENLAKIFKMNTHMSKVLSLRDVKVVNNKTFKGKVYVLVSLEKRKLFKQIQNILYPKFKELEEKYKSIDNSVAIKRFATLSSMLKEYAFIASYAQFKQIVVSTYKETTEFDFLKKIDKEYTQLQKRISFYILSDANSRVFTKYIKRAIKKEGLTISKEPLSDDSLKLLIKSVTTDEQDYSFNKSSTLIKITTYNTKNEEISFRQHTFIGKSRKSYKEAKDQSAIHLNGKIKKFGLYDFLGF